MKKVKSICTLVLLSVLFAVPSFVHAEQSSSNRALLKVNGLVCDFCATAIKKTFKKVKEVDSVDIDLTDKILTVQFREDKTLSDEALTDYVTKAGYSVVSITRE